MAELDSKHLVFFFPDVHAEAELRIFFGGSLQSEEPMSIARNQKTGEFAVTGGHELVVHFRPNIFKQVHRYPDGLRFPFAVIVNVDGTNALTGKSFSNRLLRPQNYFTTPPQGAVTGYMAGGQIHPFVSYPHGFESPVILDVRVAPMKAEAFLYLEKKRQLTPGPPPWGCHFELPTDARDGCEPIYEDICSLGDWDQDRAQQATICLHGQS